MFFGELGSAFETRLAKKTHPLGAFPEVSLYPYFYDGRN